jgi:hypothetical protein
MEVICPACHKWIEIPEHQAVAGGRCRCDECWGVLKIASVRPFRVDVVSRAETPEAAGPRTKTGRRR